MTSTPSSLEILYFKMTNGVDILAMLSSETAKTVIVTNPVQIQRVMDPSRNRLSLGMMPWVPVVELLPLFFTLKKTDISAMVEIPQEGQIINEYRRLIASLSESDNEELDMAESYEEEYEDDEQELVLSSKGRVIN